MHLLQIRFAFELLADPFLLRLQREYQRENDHASHSASSGTMLPSCLTSSKSSIFSILQDGVSVARDQESGKERGFGYYWPIASRAHEYRLPGARVTTVHRFAGASQGRAASMIIHWQEPQGIKIKWNFLDRTIDEVLLSSEQATVKRQTGSAICLYHDSNAVACSRLSLVSI